MRRLKDETTEFHAKFIVACDDTCFPRYFTVRSSAVKCATTWKKNCPTMAIFVKELASGNKEYVSLTPAKASVPERN